MSKAIPLLIIFILFIAGCGKQDSKSAEIDVFVGIEGLTAEFVKNAPPARVFEESKFPILLQVENKGSYSIGDDKWGVLTIGREKDYVNIISLEKNNRVAAGEGKEGKNEASFVIDGKTQINPRGDKIIVAFNAQTGKLDPQSETRLSAITATFCYPYKTILSTTVCIDPDITGSSPAKKVCNVKEMVFSNGQGAPVAVTKIEPQMIPEGNVVRPQFLIFMENKGKGNTVDSSAYENVCRESDFGSGKEGVKNIWNVAFLKAFTSGREDENQLECSPNVEEGADKSSGFIRFRDKKDFVRCVFKKGVPKNSNTYTSPLKIEIDYGYVQTIGANIIVQKPLKY